MIATNVVTITLCNHLDPPGAMDASTSHGTTLYGRKPLGGTEQAQLFKRVLPMFTTHDGRHAPHH